MGTLSDLLRHVTIDARIHHVNHGLKGTNLTAPITNMLPIMNDRLISLLLRNRNVVVNQARGRRLTLMMKTRHVINQTISTNNTRHLRLITTLYTRVLRFNISQNHTLRTVRRRLINKSNRVLTRDVRPSTHRRVITRYTKISVIYTGSHVNEVATIHHILRVRRHLKRKNIRVRRLTPMFYNRDPHLLNARLRNFGTAKVIPLIHQDTNLVGKNKYAGGRLRTLNL